MRIAFWGNFGTYNLGNECTLHAMLEAARRYLPAADLLAVCNAPADTVARHHLAAVPIAPALGAGWLARWRPLRQLRRLAVELCDWARVVGTVGETDIVVITGTGILTDKYEPIFGMPYQMFKWAAAARLRKKQVLFVSVGAEQLNDPVKCAFMGWALRLARYRSFRDAASRDRSQRLLHTTSPDPIFPDLAFSLPESLLVKRGDPPEGGRTVVVGIYAVEDGAAALRAYVEALGTFVLRLLDRGHRVRVVIGDADYDQAVRGRLHVWLEETGAQGRVVDEPATSFEQLMGQLAEADFVVATRFHNLVLALLLGKPVISISHMDKNDELMAAMGLSAYCVPLRDVQPSQLLDTFDRMERNADDLRRLIHRQAAAYRARLDEQYAVVFGTEADRVRAKAV